MTESKSTAATPTTSTLRHEPPPSLDGLSDGVLRAVRRSLYSAALCYTLDSLGYRRQAMDSRLRPLSPSPETCGFVGRARTLRWIEVDYIDPDNPYGREIEAMDSLTPGDVAVYSTDYSRSSAPWGELMTVVAIGRGAAGCVCDGAVRDSVKILETGFPVFCNGFSPLDSKGRGMVDAFDVPLRCGGVTVRPGDLIFADYDGVVVVPQAVEEQALELALDKVAKEDRMREDLADGVSLEQAFERHNIL